MEHWLEWKKTLNRPTMRDWSNDPLHHEQMLYHRAAIKTEIKQLSVLVMHEITLYKKLNIKKLQVKCER